MAYEKRRSNILASKLALISNIASHYKNKSNDFVTEIGVLILKMRQAFLRKILIFPPNINLFYSEYPPTPIRSLMKKDIFLGCKSINVWR
jgi:hypothetical protein